MGRNSGGSRGSSPKKSATTTPVPNTPQNIQMVKHIMTNYGNGSDSNKVFGDVSFENGFYDDIKKAVQKVSQGNYGVATDIAKSVLENSNKRQFMDGVSMSEKQAYWIAKAAIENGLINQEQGAFNLAAYYRWGATYAIDTKKLKRK